MKDTVNVRLLIQEGKHDSLLSFYGQYPRMIVNRILVRVCETLIPIYAPTLSLFQPQAHTVSGAERHITVSINKDTSPLLWAFYNDVPYGARGFVLANLLNHYVMLVENDRGILERSYWSGASGTKGDQLSGGMQVAADDHSSRELVSKSLPAKKEPDVVEPTAPAYEEEPDPMAGFIVNL